LSNEKFDVLWHRYYLEIDYISSLGRKGLDGLYLIKLGTFPYLDANSLDGE